MNEKLVKRARTVGGPLLFALGLALLFGHVAGCARQKAFFTGSDGDRQVPGQKTTPLEEPPPFQSVPWIWTYTHSETATAHIPHEVPACSTDFQLDGDCPTRNARCYFGLHIYTCLPEGKILTYEGRVVDERGNPVAGAYVYGGLGVPDFDNLSNSITRVDGRFQLLSTTCLKVLYAQKDGYRANGQFRSGLFSRCDFEKWGASNLSLTLTRHARSVSSERETPWPETGCNIIGRALDVERRPLQDVTVVIGRASLQTDTDGYYAYASTEPCPDICVGTKQNYLSESNRTHKRQSRDVVSCRFGKPDDMIFRISEDEIR